MRGCCRENKGDHRADDTPEPFDIDQGLTRLDITPQIRYPFKKWQWFTVNSTFSWRDTYYTRSQDPAAAVPLTNPNGVVDASINRRFFTAQAQITGPVFNRIWDTPDNGYAEKFKHSVEPYVTVARTSSIDNYANIVKIDGVDTIFGGNTSFVYGVTNRFFAKRRTAPGRPRSRARSSTFSSSRLITRRPRRPRSTRATRPASRHYRATRPRCRIFLPLRSPSARCRRRS